MAKRERLKFQGLIVDRKSQQAFRCLWMHAKDLIIKVRDDSLFMFPEDKRLLDICLEALETLEETDLLKELDLKKWIEEYKESLEKNRVEFMANNRRAATAGNQRQPETTTH